MGLALAIRLLPWLRPHGFWAGLGDLMLMSSWNPAWDPMRTVSWSLACEAFFYLIFPALLAVLRRCATGIVITMAAVSAISVVLLPWVNVHFGLEWPIFFPPARLPEFVLGTALGTLVLRGVWRGPGLTGATILTVAGYFLTHYVPDAFTYSSCTIGGLALLIPAGAQADLSHSPSPWRRPALVWFGKVSFSFYMVHIMVMGIGERLFSANPGFKALPALAAAIGGFLVSLIWAWILYECIELPGRRLILGNRRPSTTPTSSAASQESSKAHPNISLQKSENHPRAAL
jgi:peptidoglycan/LPS O-acetylase OafA/YrhL